MGFFQNVFGAPQDPNSNENDAMSLANVAKESARSQGGTPSYSDPALSYATSRNSAAQLGFLHVPSGQETYFMAFIEGFSDSFSSEWNEEPVYGRMDPIATFQRTSRKLSISWAIPAESYTAGYMNLVKCQGLIKFLYPTYQSGDNANSISQAPILRVKFANLIAKGRGDSLRENGLLGYLDGISFEPDLDAGFFDSLNNVWGNITQTANDPAIAPKVIKLSCTLTVLHERPLGWRGSSWADTSNDYFFPYQISSGNPTDELFTQGGEYGIDPANSGFDFLQENANTSVNPVPLGTDDPDAEADQNSQLEGDT